MARNEKPVWAIKAVRQAAAALRKAESVLRKSCKHDDFYHRVRTGKAGMGTWCINCKWCRKQLERRVDSDGNVYKIAFSPDGEGNS